MSNEQEASNASSLDTVPASPDKVLAEPTPEPVISSKREKFDWGYWAPSYFTLFSTMGFFFFMFYFYLNLHGIALQDVISSGFVPSPEFLAAIAYFDFIGVSSIQQTPSAISIFTETAFWGYVGVVASHSYKWGVAIARKQFQFVKHGARFLGEAIRSLGLAMAVVFLLRIVTLSVGPVTISLKEADIHTIIALSFVIGFFNEDTTRWLRTLWNQATRPLVSEQARDASFTE